MISTKVRLQLEEICSRIENKEEVSFSDMVLIEKWSKANRSVYDMLQRARRRAIQGLPISGTIDDLLDQVNLGNPDPETHITGDSSLDDLADFFHNDTDHMRRD
jgi:hypothetical protein